MTKEKRTVDLRRVLLEASAECFSKRHIKVFNGREYWGEDAIQYGYNLIAFTQVLDRKFHVHN